MPGALVELRGVVKRYGRARPVLDGVGLTLAGGEVVRVGGVNGSGKSTLLRLVAGVSTASGGIVTRRARATGYVPERPPANLRMTGRGYLTRMARIRGGARDERIDDLIGRLGLADWAGARMTTMSKGTAQKVLIVQALLADPDLLVLDEPWSGLDAAAQTALAAAVAERREAGACVLYTDHAERLVGVPADRALLVERGALTESAATAAVMPMRLELAAGNGAAGTLAGLPGVRRVGPLPGERLEVLVDPGAADAVLARALALGCSVRRAGPAAGP